MSTSTPDASDGDLAIEPYTVTVDDFGIDPDWTTDTGVRVGDLEPIGDCCLTPGHPSPVGRTEEGELAYVVHPNEEWICLSRIDAAHLAHLLFQDIRRELGENGATEKRSTHTASGKTAWPTLADSVREHPRGDMLAKILDVAAPTALFDMETAHGRAAWMKAFSAILNNAQK